MADLFTQSDLADFLRKPVSAEAAASAEKVVWGWLRPVLGLTDRPTPVTPEVFSWAIELGAIAYENPSGLTYYELGDERSGYSASRRAEILAEVGASDVSAVALGAPVGSFPDPYAWPDPPRYHRGL